MTGILLLTSYGKQQADQEFVYSVDKFADIEILRYKVNHFEDLSLNQVADFYLSEAAIEGRDIFTISIIR